MIYKGILLYTCIIYTTILILSLEGLVENCCIIITALAIILNAVLIQLCRTHITYREFKRLTLSNYADKISKK